MLAARHVLIFNSIADPQQLRLSMDGLPTRRFDLNNPVDPVVPAAYPHVDESINGAVQRVRKWMGEEAEGLLKGRVRLIKYGTYPFWGSF